MKTQVCFPCFTIFKSHYSISFRLVMTEFVCCEYFWYLMVFIAWKVHMCADSVHNELSCWYALCIHHVHCCSLLKTHHRCLIGKDNLILLYKIIFISCVGGIKLIHYLHYWKMLRVTNDTFSHHSSGLQTIRPYYNNISWLKDSRC